MLDTNVSQIKALKKKVMNALLHSNPPRQETMDDLAQVTPEKFQKNNNVISIQEDQQQMKQKTTIILYKNSKQKVNWKRSQH